MAACCASRCRKLALRRVGNIVFGNPNATPEPVPANVPSVSFDVPPVQLPNGVTFGKTAQPAPLPTGTTLNGGPVALAPEKPLELPANLAGSPALTVQRPDAQPKPLQPVVAAPPLAASPFELGVLRKPVAAVPAGSVPGAAPAAVPAAVQPKIPVTVQTNAPGRIIGGRALDDFEQTRNSEVNVAGGSQQRNMELLHEGGATDRVVQIKGRQRPRHQYRPRPDQRRHTAENQSRGM